MKKILVVLGILLVVLCIPTSSTAQTPQFTQPTTIRVWFVEKDPNTGVPKWKNDVVGIFKEVVDGQPNPRPIPFESDYLPNVVSRELGGNNLYSAKRAQALAARTYGLWFMVPDNRPSYCNDADPNEICDVTDSTAHQDYRPNYANDTNDWLAPQVVNDSNGQYLSHFSQSPDMPIFSQFSSDHSPSSVEYPAQPYFTNSGGTSYLKSIYDPITNGEEDSGGHGNGLSQYGAIKWARGSSHYGTLYPFWNYDQILAHYYTGIQLRNRVGTAFWSDRRWNALRIFGTQFRTWTADLVAVQAQNTGSLWWETGTKLSAYWQRCKRFGDFACEPFDPAPRPESPVANPSSIPPGGYSPTSIELWLQPPSGFYDGENNYFYYLRFDMRRPTGQYFKDAGWHEQQWKISIQNKPPAPRPPTPPCEPSKCPPTPQRSATVSWIKDPNPDDVTFVWKQTSPSGIVTGETVSTALTVNLERGENTITAKARDVTDFATESNEVVVGRFFYDPDKPTIDSFTSLPQWSNTTSFNLNWSANDTLSGIANYTLEQQIGTGSWTTLLVNTQATTYQVTNLVNNNDYTFRLTVRDNAGNVETATRIVKIDRDPPSSMLSGPTGMLPKTWTLLRWQSSYDRAPITSFAIDRLVNGNWQPLYPTIDPNSSVLLFEGQSNTTYALRIRATDAAGNQQPASPAAQITFTTSTDSSGLFKSYLPILLSNGTATSTSSVNTMTTNTTTTYPLPGQ